MDTITCTVKAVEPLTNDVYQVLLAPEHAVEFAAGQYLNILLPDGRSASFSIGCAPATDLLELHIRQVADSELACAIIDHLKQSPKVQVQLPKGDCYLNLDMLDTEQTIILAAASTGFAQIKSIMEHLINHQRRNPVYIYWGARVAADLYLLELPLQWAEQYPWVTYHPVVSDPSDACGWSGRTDLLPDAICQDFAQFDPSVQVYASGSPAMVYALLDALEAKGLKSTQMHSDVFAYAPRPK